MTFLELAESRYSVRQFQEKPIAQEHLEKIFRAAQLAPTGCNYQAFHIYVITSEKNIAKINDLSKCIFGAKTVFLFTYDTEKEWHNPLEPSAHSGMQDVSIVATHVMLEAWELGIGTCWVNYFANSKVEEAFSLPENEKVLLLMPMGYPAEDAKPLAKMHFPTKGVSDLVDFL